MAKKKLDRRKKRLYIGFVDGQPHVFTEHYGSRVISLFSNRRQAEAAYEDVREIRVVEVGKAGQ